MKIVFTKIFLILLFILVGFFYFLSYAQAGELPNVVINEIAWMGTINSANDEWIELKNLDDFDVDLEGWTIAAQDGSPEINLSGTILAGGYFLLERTDDESAPNIVADLIYSGAMGNLGETMGLADDESNLIDIIDMADGWEFGDNETKQTMERTDDGSWQTSEGVGGTPGTINGTINSTINENETVGEEDQDANIEFNLGDIVINEFVSDPGDNDTEWVELFNKFSEPVDLDGWYLEEGSGSKTSLEGLINRFFVIENIKGNLNNAGDSISLYDASGKLIDKVIYGNENNYAPIANDPNSVARNIDGYNTFDNANDFSKTNLATKGSANIIEIDNDEIGVEEMKDFEYSKDVIISEILPNPIGEDTKEEFIELANIGKQKINLRGWRLGDESKNQYKIKENLDILPNEFLVFKRSETKIALNNSGDSVRLFEPLKDNFLQSIEYKKAKEGQSYVASICATSSKKIIDEWVWTKVVTPGKINYVEAINNTPEIQFDFPEIIEVGTTVVFDGSDTIDLDGDDLNFSWDFGDGINLGLPSPGHAYLKTGTYVIKLAVSDGEEDAVEEKIVKVVPSSYKYSKSESSVGVAEVVINEVFPNPKGVDKEAEFIEIKNNGDERVNLENWILKDLKNEYRFEKFYLESGQIAVFEQADTKINLNNTSDEIKLIDLRGKEVFSVRYDFSFENNSYAIGENKNWFWTSTPTPGEENIISFSGVELGLFNDFTSSEAGMVFDVELDSIRNLDKGVLVKTRGIVAVKPGILGSQYFYIVGEGEGAQIYNYKKDFPDLEIGDYISVQGEVSVSAGEKRIKTKSKEDIETIDQEQIIEAEEISMEEASNEEYIGALVSVAGEVVEKKGAVIYLDDGTDELKVYIKKLTGVDTTEIKEGDELSVKGILGLTRSGPRLLPRLSEDIEIMGGDSAGNFNVLGEVEENDEWEIKPRNKKLELFKYLFAISIAFGAVLVVLLVRSKKMDVH